MSRNTFLTEERLVPQRGTGQVSGLPTVGAPETLRTDDGNRMTMKGVTTATGFLFVLLLASAMVGWGLVTAPDGSVQFPGWMMGATLLGFGLLMAAYFKPAYAKFLGPAYAIVEGVIVGAVSKLYESQFDGIVMQATLATIGIFFGMLAVYTTGLIKVTDKFRRGVMAATMAIMAMYLIQLVSRFLPFGDFEIPFLHDSGPIGILLSLGIIVIAAFNYLLDFDQIERGIARGAHRDQEWVAALGLLWTTVWIYFEVLRLLSKLRD